METNGLKLKQDVKAEIGSQNYAVHITSHSQQWCADEPVVSGGQDKGPNPFELLMSSLASCTLITMRMYAERKGWDLKAAAVDINFTFEDQHKKRISSVFRKITVQGELDQVQTDRLLHIAQVCPVAKILEGTIKIDTQLFR